MAKPPLNGVAETEYTKSHIRERSPLSRRRQHTCFAYVLIPAFSFAKAGAKEKRRYEISRSAERDKSYALLMSPPFEKGGVKTSWQTKTFVSCAQKRKRRALRNFPFSANFSKSRALPLHENE